MRPKRLRHQRKTKQSLINTRKCTTVYNNYYERTGNDFERTVQMVYVLALNSRDIRMKTEKREE